MILINYINQIESILKDLENPSTVLIEQPFGRISRCVDKPQEIENYLSSLFEDLRLDSLLNDDERSMFWKFIKRNHDRVEISTYEKAAQYLIITLQKIMDSFTSPEIKLICQSNLSLINKVKLISYEKILSLFRSKIKNGQAIIKTPDLGDLTISSIFHFIELCKGVLTTWKTTEKSSEIRDKANKIEGLIQNRMDELWNTKKIHLGGCSHVCPVCGQKCSKPRDHAGDHFTEHHIYPAFNGRKTSNNNHGKFELCNNPKNWNEKWTENLWTYDEFVRNRSNGTWKITPSEDNYYEHYIQKAWTGTEQFWRLVHNIHGPKEPWEANYTTKKLNQTQRISGYTDKFDFPRLEAQFAETAQKPYVQSPSILLDIVICIDVTGSMQAYIDQAKNAAHRIIENSKSSGCNTKIGIVGYRDHGDTNMLQVKDLASYEDVSNFIASLRAGGGGDAPEAVHDGLHAAVNRISWRENSRRYIFHIGDQPPHGPEYATGGYCCGLKIGDIALGMNQKKIKYVLIMIKASKLDLTKMAEVFKLNFLSFEQLDIDASYQFEQAPATVIARDLTNLYEEMKYKDM